MDDALENNAAVMGTQQPESLAGQAWGPTLVSDNGRVLQGNVNSYNFHYSSRLKAVDYNSINERERRIQSAVAETCEWIWSTKFGEWISDPQATMFWISGKPGSGKSTLIKHLAESPITRENLPAIDNDWIIVTLFFDFTEGSKIANSIEGLLKRLITQIAETIPSSDSRLARDKRLSNSELHLLLRDILSDATRRFLIFLDGLDENANELPELCRLVLSLQVHQNVKLCVASRRNPTINRRFSHITNLHMSKHNSSGIFNYVNAEIEKLKENMADFQALDFQEIQQILCERAEGVFLWVYYALREVDHAIDRDRTVQEIMRLLKGLPQELEEIYQRIIDRVEIAQRREAALLYTLLEDTEVYPITTQILFAAYQFLAHEVGLEGIPADVVNLKHFEKMLDGTLDGLFELYPQADARLTTGGDSSLVPKMMHETVRTFSAKSCWYKFWQPQRFKQLFPNLTWARLCCYALVRAHEQVTEADAAELKTAFESIPNTGYVSFNMAGCMNYVDFADILNTQLRHNSIVHWSRLLHLSMDAIFVYAEQMIESEDETLKSNLPIVMRSRWVHMRLVLWQCDSTVTCKPGKLLYCDFADLVQAAVHNCFRYLLSQRDRIAALPEIARGAICCGVVLEMGVMQTKELSSLKESEDDYPDCYRAIDEILCQDTQLYSYHLALYLCVGYSNVPQYLRKHWETPSIKDGPVLTPLWSRSMHIFTSTNERPLFVWACQRPSDNQEGCTEQAQLNVLLHFGVDINGQSSQGMNIVHYLITKHIVEHIFLKQDPNCWPDGDAAIPIEQLYWLEEARADFDSIFEDMTPLQALRNGYNRIKACNHRDLLYSLDEEEILRFTQLKFMLSHKESHGHLPQPMMGVAARGEAAIPTLTQYVKSKHCDLCMQKSVSDSDQVRVA